MKPFKMTLRFFLLHIRQMQKLLKLLMQQEKFEQNVYVQEKNVKKEDLIEESHETFIFVLTFYICFAFEYAFQNIYSFSTNHV